ncbi:hypothetical protein [Ensifer aridi]|uniref:hypothetical protein n=1 Tax=Ensifer aridi TaxID=1708715 RepID=UPI000A832604|nr:hypothetical protein [Ensifer aridi]
MPDLFVVAATNLPWSGGKFSTTFEKDIAPLELDDPIPGKRSVVLPVKRSVRSRFARSTTQNVKWPTSSLTLTDLSLMFPTVLEVIASAGARTLGETALIGGPTIREFVFEGASVRLDAEIVGEFALTLWFFGSDHVRPGVAEISFKCTTVRGDMLGKAARRALDLFIGMQELDGWVNTEHFSKTSLALPMQCGSPVN